MSCAASAYKPRWDWRVQDQAQRSFWTMGGNSSGDTATQAWWLTQGILKGEISLYHWPPVWLVWISLFCIVSCHTADSKPVKQEVNGQWYSDTFPFSIPWLPSRKGPDWLQTGYGDSGHWSTRSQGPLPEAAPLLDSLISRTILLITTLLFSTIGIGTAVIYARKKICIFCDRPILPTGLTTWKTESRFPASLSTLSTTLSGSTRGVDVIKVFLFVADAPA
jgi:hypothetical protein